ncbi:hypothetical protein [Micromonospora sp. NPDC006431]|uniref:hypothetical protein n=1 Tax=Micromonospora sp. NPDC006431 TaxID=3364235 RepID=UPI0036B96C98
MTTAPVTGSLLSAMTTLPEIDLTVCGSGGALGLTVTRSVRGLLSPVTVIFAWAPLAAGALPAADRVKGTCFGPGVSKLIGPQPPQVTPSGRSVMSMSAEVSPMSGLTTTLTELLLPASIVTESSAEVILAAEAGVAGTASSAPTTSATTTPAR